MLSFLLYLKDFGKQESLYHKQQFRHETLMSPQDEKEKQTSIYERD